MKHETVIIIPARMTSQRLPGKPLMMIKGIPLVRRVYEQCIEAKVGPVYVAADSLAILDLIPSDSQILVQAPVHSGTDRVALAAEMLDLPSGARVLNIQGDIPFIPPQLVREFAHFMEHKECGTAVIPSLHPVPDGYVSAVLNTRDEAMMFSRSRLPSGTAHHILHYQHIGIYGYEVSKLLQFACFTPSMLERAESLEQLRVLENRIAAMYCMVTSHYPGLEVNTPEDLEKVNR